MTIPKLNSSIKGLTVKQVDYTNGNFDVTKNIVNQVSNDVTATNTEVVEEKEYSTAQFKKDYREIFQNEVLTPIRSCDEERVKTRNKAIAASTGMVLLAFTILIGSVIFLPDTSSSADDAIGKLFWACIGGAYGVWFLIKKKFENKLKNMVMPKLMKAFPGFYYQRTPSLTKDEINDSMILPNSMKFKNTDDCFFGEYKNVKIDITECEYIKDRDHNFRGAMVRIKMNKSFEGYTVIRPKKCGYRDNYKDLKKADLKEVKLEDTEFDKQYAIYSTDQIEARYLITTAFMERFKKMMKCFSAKCAYCSFSNDSIIIGLHTGKDLFSIGALTKPVTDFKQFDILLEEFVSIIEFVDLYKLDKKLGL